MAAAISASVENCLYLFKSHSSPEPEFLLARADSWRGFIRFEPLILINSTMSQDGHIQTSLFRDLLDDQLSDNQDHLGAQPLE